MILPRLPHTAPVWERSVDVVVVGSGVAGLSVALAAAQVGTVLLVTKAALDAGSTSWAQGGIAAAIDIADTPEQHLHDTLVAGAGLCSEQAVRVLVEEGPQRLAKLISVGAVLDTDDSGNLSLTREGGHGRARIVHAGGDATGAEVQRALQEAVRREPKVEIVEDGFVVDLLLAAATGATAAGNGARRARSPVAGALVHTVSGGLGVVRCRAVCLATGGLGQVFASTTNPPVATGDGIALALRAGAAVADMEFVQFHPTVFWRGPGATGQQILVSEAVRGEGAFLVDAAGARVMEGVHPMADLAPRDVVAKAMSVRMAAQGVDHLFLDARGLGEAKILKRFPNIVAGCRAAGIDPVVDLIPVAPGEHFLCGGVHTDRNGRTGVPGLYAVGETACTGVHGANRLASNSLLEGLVYGERVGAQLVLNLGASHEPLLPPTPTASLHADDRARIGAVMSRDAAVKRSGVSLDAAWHDVGAFAAGRRAGSAHDAADTSADTSVAAWEAANVHACAMTVIAGARRREESRGCHWREDFPDTSDAWLRRITTTIDADGGFLHAEVGLEDTP